LWPCGQLSASERGHVRVIIERQKGWHNVGF